MADATPLKILFTCVLGLAIILAIVALGVNPRVTNPVKNSFDDTAIAFNLIGLFVLFAAIIITIILFFTCEDKSQILMLTVIILVAVAVFCFIVATGVWHRLPPTPGTWLMSVLWITVIALAICIILIVVGDE